MKQILPQSASLRESPLICRSIMGLMDSGKIYHSLRPETERHVGEGCLFFLHLSRYAVPLPPPPPTKQASRHMGEGCLFFFATSQCHLVIPSPLTLDGQNLHIHTHTHIYRIGDKLPDPNWKCQWIYSERMVFKTKHHIFLMKHLRPIWHWCTLRGGFAKTSGVSGSDRLSKNSTRRQETLQGDSGPLLHLDQSEPLGHGWGDFLFVTIDPWVRSPQEVWPREVRSADISPPPNLGCWPVICPSPLWPSLPVLQCRLWLFFGFSGSRSGSRSKLANWFGEILILNGYRNQKETQHLDSKKDLDLRLLTNMSQHLFLQVTGVQNAWKAQTRPNGHRSNNIISRWKSRLYFGGGGVSSHLRTQAKDKDKGESNSCETSVYVTPALFEQRPPWKLVFSANFSIWYRTTNIQKDSSHKNNCALIIYTLF